MNAILQTFRDRLAAAGLVVETPPLRLPVWRPVHALDPAGPFRHGEGPKLREASQAPS